VDGEPLADLAADLQANETDVPALKLTTSDSFVDTAKKI
jgi:hypothetical protein